MDPLTLHFNIFQASSAPSKRSHQIDDPQSTTVGALKRQLFLEALEEQRSVRFIASGKILGDAEPLHRCGLVGEAHIHVSISEARPEPSHTESVSSASGGDRGPNREAHPAKVEHGTSSRSEGEESAIGVIPLLGAIIIAGAGILLKLAWRKRWYLSLHASQLICILAAVWVYLLAFHSLPTLCRALVQILLRRGGTPSVAAQAQPSDDLPAGSSNTTTGPAVGGCGLLESLDPDFTSAASSSAPAPAPAPASSIAAM